MNFKTKKLINFKKLIISFSFLILSVLFLFVLKDKKTNTLHKQYVVSITQIAPHPSLDLIREGVIETLKKEFGNDIKINYQSSQSNRAIAMQIAQKFASDDSNVIVSITTPSTQSIKATKTKKPVVFVGVTNPEIININNTDNITGVSDKPDITAQVNLIKKYFKDGCVVGCVYSSFEANATFQAKRFKQVIEKDKKYKVIEKAINNVNDITLSINSIIKDVDCIFIGNDNAIISIFPAILKIAKIHNKPIFTSDPQSVDKGAIAAICIDQKEMGIQAAKQVIQVLNGKNIKEIPILYCKSVEKTGKVFR